MYDPAETRWRRAFTAVAEAAALVGTDGRIELATEGFLTLVGLGPGDVLGRPCRAVLGLRAENDPVSATLAEGAPQLRELRTPEMTRPALLTTHPYEIDGKRAAVVVLSEAALVERQRLLDTARLADVGTLAGGFAHEINSPLAAIALRAESLLQASRNPALVEQPAFERFPRYLKAICDDLFRCKEIVSGLLEYARPRAGSRQVVRLEALAEHAATMLGHTARARGIELASVSHASPAVRVDPSQLLQAVIAVARNAIEASAEGATVTLETRPAEGGSELVVRDAGRGIAADMRDRVLVPFFTTKAPGEGMGLGLSLASSITGANGGTLLIESEPGQGTRVTLRFPGAA